MDTTTPTAVAQYNAQERVLCYHGNHVYEAKVLKTKNFDEPSPTTGEVGPHYLVHYKGWKQTCVFFYLGSYGETSDWAYTINEYFPWFKLPFPFPPAIFHIFGFVTRC